MEVPIALEDLLKSAWGLRPDIKLKCSKSVFRENNIEEEHEAAERPWLCDYVA